MIRWLHIYLSMFGLAATLFFSLTGITLNHPSWAFPGAERQRRAEGQIDRKWLGGEVARLEVVEHLRAAQRVRGALAEFRVDETEAVVTFKGPGYEADAFIDRESGRYDLTVVEHGAIAWANDLHKGRDTGRAWSLAIDLAAGLLTLISATGLALLFYLKLRRRPGLALALVGLIATAAVAVFGVP